MGYTHYWTQPRALTADEMAEIGDVVTRLIAEADGKTTKTAGGYHTNVPLKVRNGLGVDEPEITTAVISFNGDDVGDQGHETFQIAADRPGWDFCKTARKPYDVVVTATLAYLAARWDFKVSSDGDPDDWVEGLKLAETVLGEPVACPLSRED